VPRPRYHAAVSLTIASLVVLRSRRWRDAVPVLVAGVLVDVDHLVDLAVTRATGKAEWIILPLHAWEWVFGLLGFGGRLGQRMAGGLAAHLALDQLNSVIRHPFFYWIVVRAGYRFRAAAQLVDPEEFERKASWMQEAPGTWF
jgi:hypothetical protein